MAQYCSSAIAVYLIKATAEVAVLSKTKLNCEFILLLSFNIAAVKKNQTDLIAMVIFKMTKIIFGDFRTFC